jgi:hypothetical protein
MRRVSSIFMVLETLMDLTFLSLYSTVPEDLIISAYDLQINCLCYSVEKAFSVNLEIVPKKNSG